MESNQETNNNDLFKTAIGIAAGAYLGKKAHTGVKGMAKGANVSTKDMYKRIGSNLKTNYKDVGSVLNKGTSKIIGTGIEAGRFATNGVLNSVPITHIGKEIGENVTSDLREIGGDLKNILSKEVKINPNKAV